MTITIEISPQQLSTLITAMAEKVVETERYLRSSRVGHPESTDLCCEAHRARYEHRKSVSDSLELRERQENALLTMLMELDKHE